MKNKKRAKEIKLVLTTMDKFFAKRNIIFSSTYTPKKNKQEMAEAN